MVGNLPSMFENLRHTKDQQMHLEKESKDMQIITEVVLPNESEEKVGRVVQVEFSHHTEYLNVLTEHGKPSAAISYNFKIFHLCSEGMGVEIDFNLSH